MEWSEIQFQYVINNSISLVLYRQNTECFQNRTVSGFLDITHGKNLFPSVNMEFIIIHNKFLI